ncbi:MAG TPA: IgGFc-binding protein, partial [Candidatus Nanopelagicales bacterium]|nr:IgGFc-binding protein [Candidatus Nanopelagicales bacterium]
APPACPAGELRCSIGRLERCEGSGASLGWAVIEDCGSQGLVCGSVELGCTACYPNENGCRGQEVVACGADGSFGATIETCDPSVGEACREGSCPDLCESAGEERSNVGCEYWAVDLDNAMIDATSNAAAQQFAVVVSNPQPDVPVRVRIFQDDGAPGDAPAPVEIAAAVIAPLNLQVFKLGPREVDGSPEGEFNTGTHTALTRHAYKITSDFPVVAYQFNPLENVNVFSNDASLLKPREALTYDVGVMGTAYVVAGWPQTIAATDDPDTNFNPLNPIHLRAFLTIVGTMDETRVRVKTTAKVVPGGPVAETQAGGWIEATIGAFDVLNLETGDFDADFTGSLVEADKPVAVFVGGEASDAPTFATLSTRRCCADHLEDQLDPIRAAGKLFAVPHTPSRTAAVKAAGAQIEQIPEPDYVRFVATTTNGARVKTTLPPPDDELILTAQGVFREVTAWRDFMVESTQPIIVAHVMASQDAAGVKRGLPGGDPSLLIVPPSEQFRPDYVFLTPDKYAFDFVSVVAPPTASVTLDGAVLGPELCEVSPADGLTPEERGTGTPPLVVYRCQLSFPVIDPLKSSPDNLSPGQQSDGVHRVLASAPVGVVVSGFDSFVSYAYAGGTELKEIAPPQ